MTSILIMVLVVCGYKAYGTFPRENAVTGVIVGLVAVLCGGSIANLVLTIGW